jgi:hypothetical protein
VNHGGGSIVWLASYPSSGNTWMRVFLSNLICDAGEPADINHLAVTVHAASRGRFDTHAGVRASELTDDEIDELRPAVYESMAREEPGPWFIKIHDAYAHTPSGRPLISQPATRGAIYVIRNPLDVAVSYAHHQNVSLDACIRIMADETHALGSGANGIRSQLKQRVGSWSTHVHSWVDADALRLHVVRYEDLKRDPVRAFGAVADFARLAWTPHQLERAIAFSDFRELRRQEDLAGFSAGSPHADRFFRRGETAVWRTELTDSQARRIIEQHHGLMRRFGYLDQDGTPL